MESQDTTLTPSSNIIMTSIATGAYAAVSQTAFISALPNCEGIAYEEHFISIVIKRLRKMQRQEKTQEHKAKFQTIIEPRPFVNARSSPIYVKHYIKSLIFTFSLQNPLSV